MCHALAASTCDYITSLLHDSGDLEVFIARDSDEVLSSLRNVYVSLCEADDAQYDVAPECARKCLPGKRSCVDPVSILSGFGLWC
eukprot:1834339-Pyramimonas_sp.AAC.1